MIAIDCERCDGCGVCVEVCAVGAIYLVGGKATIDEALCRDFRARMVTNMAACVAACPMEAIAFNEQARRPERDLACVPARRPQPEVVRVGRPPMLLSWRAQVLPAMGAVVAWAGREIVPWLADTLLHDLDRRVTERRTATNATSGGSRSHERQQGKRRRRRRRGS